MHKIVIAIGRIDSLTGIKMVAGVNRDGAGPKGSVSRIKNQISIILKNSLGDTLFTCHGMKNRAGFFSI